MFDSGKPGENTIPISGQRADQYTCAERRERWRNGDLESGLCREEINE